MTMLRIFYNNSVQTVLRSMAMLTVILLGNVSTNAQESDDEYLPFLEEGKTWKVTYYVRENTDSYNRTYIVQGNTVELQGETTVNTGTTLNINN